VADAGTLAVVAGAVFLGAFLNTLAGFGFALVTVPLMALVVGPKEAVVLSAIVGLASNGAVAIRLRRQVDRTVTGRVLAGSMLGMPIGIVVLGLVADEPLKVMISIAVLVSAVLLATGWRLHDPKPATDVVAGFVSGACNTSIGISGPPVVVLMQGRGMPKATFRASIVAVFFVAGIVALVLFGVTGRFDATVGSAALVALPALPLGWWLGDVSHRRLDEAPFRVVVLVLMSASAVVVLASVVFG
jgi:uncharacterized protein